MPIWGDLPTDHVPTLARALQRELINRNISQIEAAKSLGVRQPTFRAWLFNINSPKDENVGPLAQWLGVSVVELGAMNAWGQVERAANKARTELADAEYIELSLSKGTTQPKAAQPLARRRGSAAGAPKTKPPGSKRRARRPPSG